jgi:hypothetical protein
MQSLQAALQRYGFLAQNVASHFQDLLLGNF